MVNASHDKSDCRFYENEYPEKEDLVMVKVTKIADMGAYVQLLEYGKREGMILLSELSKRRYRSLGKLIRVGRHEVVMVLRVDKVKGYIDLSKRRVSPEDIIKCEERFSNAKKVHQTARHLARQCNLEVEEVNNRIIWPLYRKYGNALIGLKEAVIRPDEVLGELDITEEMKTLLINDIKLRMTPRPLRFTAIFELCCLGKYGITAIQNALNEGLEYLKETTNAEYEKLSETQKNEFENTIRLIAAPEYVLSVSGFKKELGITTVKNTLEKISQEIQKYEGGSFKHNGQISRVGVDEDGHLQSMLRDSEGSESDDEDESNESDISGMGVADSSDSDNDN